MAEEAGISRLYGGIHYRFDIDGGRKTGEIIGQTVVEKDPTVGWVNRIQ